jgi:hypothetical protein
MNILMNLIILMILMIALIKNINFEDLPVIPVKKSLTEQFSHTIPYSLVA